MRPDSGPAHGHVRHDTVVIHLLDREHDRAVVDEQLIAHRHVRQQRLVIDRDLLFSTRLGAKLCIQRKRLARGQLHRAVGERLDANLRTLQIGEHRHRLIELRRRGARGRHALSMRVPVAVGEIDPDHVDAG